MKKLRFVAILAVLIVGIGAGSYNAVAKKYGYAPVVSTPYYQNGATTVFGGPISVPSCTGCGGGGGSSDMPFYTMGNAVYLTTTTNSVALGSAHAGDSPLTIESDTSTMDGQIELINGETDGVAAINFSQAPAPGGGSKQGAGFIGSTGSTTSMLPPNAFVVANTDDAANSNGLILVADGNGPGATLSPTNNLDVKGQYMSDTHGDFSHATYGWSDSPGDGLSLVGPGKSVMIAGGAYAMTFAQSDNESLVNFNPYTNNSQTLGQFGNAWGGIYASGTSNLTNIRAVTTTLTGALVVPLGARAAPAIVGPDVDTGLYFLNSGQDILFTRNNTNILSIETAGIKAYNNAPILSATNNGSPLGGFGNAFAGVYASSTSYFADIIASTVTSTNSYISNRLTANSTNTPVGTTGAQTINKLSGSVNLAAAASSLVVTDSLVSTSSHIFATIETHDGNAMSVQAVPSLGSFTMYPNSPPLAETRVDFFIIN